MLPLSKLLPKRFRGACALILFGAWLLSFAFSDISKRWMPITGLLPLRAGQATTSAPFRIREAGRYQIEWSVKPPDVDWSKLHPDFTESFRHAFRVEITQGNKVIADVAIDQWRHVGTIYSQRVSKYASDLILELPAARNVILQITPVRDVEVPSLAPVTYTLSRLGNPTGEIIQRQLAPCLGVIVLLSGLIALARRGWANATDRHEAQLV